MNRGPLAYALPAVWGLLLANLGYLAVSHSERIVRPRRPAAYRQLALCVAIALALVLPAAWALVP